MPKIDRVPFLENGLRFFADVSGGQKTGFFLDQRDNRARLRALSPRAARAQPLLLLRRLLGRGPRRRRRRVPWTSTRPPPRSRSRASTARANAPVRRRLATSSRRDVFEDLRRRVAEGQRWDAVVCDPPAFARKKADVERAARGYKDVNRLAMTLVAPGGWLLTCSCSGLVDADLFQKIVFSASAEARRRVRADRAAGRRARITRSRSTAPKGEYLKGFWMRRAG